MEKQVRLWGPFISKVAIWSTLASVKAWSWISFVYGVSDGKKRSPLVPVWQQTPRGFPSGLWAIWNAKYDLKAIEYQPWPNAGEKQADQTVGIRQVSKLAVKNPGWSHIKIAKHGQKGKIARELFSQTLLLSRRWGFLTCSWKLGKNCGHLTVWGGVQSKQNITLPEANSQNTWKWMVTWLEDYFSFGKAHFQELC